MELKDKVVIITGGSKGFGKSLAKAFTAEGSHVIIASDNKDDLEKTAKELFVDSFLSDVTKVEDISSLSDYVAKEYGVIDIWINNAGIQIAPSEVENVDINKLHHLFDVNFFGYFYGCQAAIRHMKSQKRGLIINVNSTAGLDGKLGLTAYSSSKFAVKGLTESLRKEVAGSDIKVCALYPGGMQTDIYHERVPEDIKEYMYVEDVVEKVIDNLKSDTPQEDLVIKRPIAK